MFMGWQYLMPGEQFMWGLYLLLSIVFALCTLASLGIAEKYPLGGLIAMVVCGYLTKVTFVASAAIVAEAAKLAGLCR